LTADKYQVAFNIEDREAYVIDLLYSLILQSGCDSACALAKHLAGSEENFVRLMNQKAEALGLTDTHFANSYGGDNENNYSTVREVGEFFLYALENPLAYKIITAKTGDYKFYGEYKNYIYTPSLVMEAFKNHKTGDITVLGGKSGHDEQAGYCLVSFGRDEGGKRYLAVTAGNTAYKSSYTDSARIYKDYVN
jgi:D-alanyl-D-alanine carboxypeptidase (penicillin-binding protein 5/6)